MVGQRMWSAQESSGCNCTLHSKIVGDGKKFKLSKNVKNVNLNHRC